MIVVSFRPGDWLAPCLTSALSQADEVVVVDNASAGESASTTARRLGARVVRVDDNLGFAGGVEVGLRHTRADVIGVLNDDATAGPGWLDAASVVLADPSVAAVTPKVLLSGSYAEVARPARPGSAAPGSAAPASAAPGLAVPGSASRGRPDRRRLESVTVGGVEMLSRTLGSAVETENGWPPDGAEPTRLVSPGARFYVPVPDEGAPAPICVDGQEVSPGPVVRLINHAGSYLGRDGMAGEYGLGAPDDGRFDVPAERFGFSATAPVFRADTLRRLGSFAPRFFAYYEDTDWCLRARLAGYRILYEPAVAVTHRLSATSGGQASLLVRRLVQRNTVLSLLRNGPAPVAWSRTARALLGRRVPGVRGSVLSNLPWAIYTRMAMRRLWVATPGEVWEMWAGKDCIWDSSPVSRSPRADD